MPMTVARWVLRITFLVQLLLGIGLWTGSFDVVKPVHIVLGVLFVLTMWTIAALALRAGGNRVLGGVILPWGALLVLFGLTQEGIVAGGLHWTIQVLHLVVAMAGIGMTEALVRRTEVAAAAG
jgi:hypothetical protein